MIESNSHTFFLTLKRSTIYRIWDILSHSRDIERTGLQNLIRAAILLEPSVLV